MYALFGVCTHSLSHVLDRIRTDMAAQAPVVRVVDMPNARQPLPDWEAFRQSWRSVHVALFPGLRELRAWAPLMDRAPFIGVVHDSPLLLNEVQGVRFLDTQPEGTGFSFALSALDLRPLAAALPKVKGRNGEHASIQVAQQIDLIPTIIDQEREGQFLDKYNNFLYRCTGAGNRMPLRRAVIQYLFSYITAEQLSAVVDRHLPARGAAREVYAEMTAWLATDDGVRLRAAFAEIRKAKGGDAAINYSSISKRHRVDRYELRYLTLMLRREQAADKPRTMREAVAEVRKGRAATLAKRAGLAEAA